MRISNRLAPAQISTQDSKGLPQSWVCCQTQESLDLASGNNPGIIYPRGPITTHDSERFVESWVCCQREEDHRRCGTGFGLRFISQRWNHLPPEARFPLRAQRGYVRAESAVRRRNARRIAFTVVQNFDLDSSNSLVQLLPEAAFQSGPRKNSLGRDLRPDA